ncbi:hypothetical protein OAA18_00610, partial [bacterium]|nr:hypothetical protein [bacterium]
QEVTFIIGLPGSGKSTLIKYYKSHPFIDYKIYDDWMECTFDKFKIKEFNNECRYPDLIESISQNFHALITGIDFCKSDFLLKSEYYLKLKFPNIKINRIYFENDPIKAESNIRYRDKQNGGYWEPNENGEMWYYGTIFNNQPLYQQEINNVLSLSPNYIIPKNSTVFPIITQKE